MVGGGPGGFIGAVHRIAARLDDRFELVAAALSSDPARARAAALDLHIAPIGLTAASQKWPRRRPKEKIASMRLPS